MNPDSDLERMFEAQRVEDEMLAPAFKEFEGRFRGADERTPFATRRRPWTSAGIVAVTAGLILIVGIVGWVGTPRATDVRGPVVSELDVQRLNQACDEILATIEGIEPERSSSPEAREPEMDWQTVSDALLTFDPFIFSTRTSP